jgi:exosortase/archaeosortase family protein
MNAMAGATSEGSPARSQTASAQPGEGWSALARIVVLAALTLWAFGEETIKTFAQATSMVQSSYVLATPVLIGLLIHRRRYRLRAALGSGSVWGVVVLAVAIAGYALTTWPFYFGYARKLTLVVALVGIVLAVGGWRLLWRSTPMLLLTALAMPLGWYTYANLISRPERMMVRGSAAVLRALPETNVVVRHGDVHYTHGDAQGTIGLGDFHFGSAAPVAFLSAIVFVIFASVRPTWQTLLLLALAVPLTAAGNFIRMVLHGLLTIYTGAEPIASMPRDVSTIVALALTYLLTCLVAWLLSSLMVEAEDAHDEASEAV